MFWQILPHASACVASERIILLDVRQDRYFIVPPRLEDAFRQWLASGGTSPPASVAGLLARSGIHRIGDPESTTAIRGDVPVPLTLDTWSASPKHIGLVDRQRASTIVAVTWIELRTWSLQAHLERHRRTAHLPQDQARLLERAQMFEHVRRSIPVPRHCLLDSLAMARWLSRGDLGCTLVFGVTPTPFAAHCWLQSPMAILNDSYDQVSRYTPILAL